MQTNKWSVAATYAIMLALVTIISTIIPSVFSDLPGFVGIILWVIKFALSIYLVYYFIKEYSKHFEVFTYKDGFRFGVILCFLSSVIGAAYMFLHFGFLFPEATATQMESVIQNLESSNPDAAETFMKVMQHLPKIVFAWSLVYYTLFGVLVSSIVANYTKKGDIFTEK